MESFVELGLSKNILKVIEELKFVKPSDIQKRIIPLVLQGKDVIGYAATGSGKTLAFGVRIAEKVKKGKGIQALILTPTRELAEQVGDAVKTFSKHFGLTMQKVYGGVSMEPQIRGLKKAEVVIATPGRLLDLLRRGTLELNNIHILVLDEADRLADMGFMPDVEQIIKLCSKNRQTMLFSATGSQDVNYIQKKYMKDAEIIEVIKYVDPSKLKQIYYDVPTNMKFSLLVHLLKHDKSELVMVFCNTKANTDIVAKNLKNVEINALPIHGGLGQGKRSNILKQFHDEHIRVLVCTDVAARGLDIKKVTHVYNYDSPKTNKEYIHRVGRTARAGKEGEAISLISERDYDNFRKVLSDSSLHIVPKEVPKIERIPFQFKRYGDRNRGDYRGQKRDSYGGRPSSRSYGRREGSYDNKSSSGSSRGYGNRSEGRSYGNRSSSGSYGRREGSYGNRQRSYGGRDNRDNKDNKDNKDNRSDRPRPTGGRKFGDRSRYNQNKEIHSPQQQKPFSRNKRRWGRNKRE